jgi:quercetin dioxygenase-like cupin family protein
MTYFCDTDSRAPKELTPGVRTRTFWADRMLVSILEFAPHAVVPSHRHAEEQVGVVLEGELYMTIAGETGLMKAGESYVIPAEIEHGGRTADRPARVFDAFSPVRADYRY